MKIVSACLVGVPCRWDGIDKKQEKLMKLLESGDALPLWPEQLGGLSTPREPSEIVGDRVISKFGNDVTEEFKSGAEIVLNIAKQIGCTQAILKAKSPSCGCNKIYDGTFTGNLIDGDGITAKLLKEHGIEVITEEDI